MTAPELEKLKYPIGKFISPDSISKEQIQIWISDISKLPQSVETTIMNMSIEDLNLPYRPDGWNIKQVVHHLADSHMNAFIRFKLALTEESPIIKPYEEDKWATLDDATSDDIHNSLGLLKHLHAKWAKLLRTLTEEDFKLVYIHPEHGKRFLLEEALGMYVWHGNHHLAHIQQALQHQGSF
ncbi:MAG TPA: putative metal-dependent hydrolase [Aquaticitalea sp.]|nr:putative metal-dependent hydrolase [Aquaticitalea sp.]